MERGTGASTPSACARCVRYQDPARVVQIEKTEVATQATLDNIERNGHARREVSRSWRA